MKQLYFKLKQNCVSPILNLSYCYKDFDNNLILAKIFINLREDEHKNIKRLEQIKSKFGQFFVSFNCNEGCEIKFKVSEIPSEVDLIIVSVD